MKLIPSKDFQFIVPNTQECIVSAIADQFGASVETTLTDLDQLIRQPRGCGEQTMLFMAPTLYTLRYLESVDRLNGDLLHRGTKFLRDGYKRELSFRKEDGSFSAFPIRPSSVWLTAFVSKVFCQALRFIPEIDDSVIYTALHWLTKKQHFDGSWTEKHPPIHETALGGVQGTIPLTAYVLIAYHECSRSIGLTDFVMPNNVNPYERAINK